VNRQERRQRTKRILGHRVRQVFVDEASEFGRSSTVERVDVAHEAAGSIPVGQPMMGGPHLEHPEDAIHFDVGFTCPPAAGMHRHALAAALLAGACVCESVDEEHGIVTYRSVRPCELQWPMQECER
jgi:hypothetical protein